MFHSWIQENHATVTALRDVTPALAKAYLGNLIKREVSGRAVIDTIWNGGFLADLFTGSWFDVPDLDDTASRACRWAIGCAWVGIRASDSFKDKF
jgi:hypothetical protein